MHGEALLMTLQTLGLPAPSDVTRPGRRTRLASEGDVAVAGRHVRGSAPRADDGAHRFVFDNEKCAHEVDARGVRHRAALRDE